MIIRVILCVIGFVILSGIYIVNRFRPDEHGRIIPWGQRVDISVLPQFQQSLRDVTGVELFEGLPRSQKKSTGAETENHRKTTFKSHGYRFYEAIFLPGEEELGEIVDCLTSENAITEWFGTKMCGGFHPDYLLRWRDTGGKSYEAHICFGCHEIRLYGGGERLYADLSAAAYERLWKTLYKYSAYGDRTFFALDIEKEFNGSDGGQRIIDSLSRLHRWTEVEVTTAKNVVQFSLFPYLSPSDQRQISLIAHVKESHVEMRGHPISTEGIRPEILNSIDQTDSSFILGLLVDSIVSGEVLGLFLDQLVDIDSLQIALHWHDELVPDDHAFADEKETL